MSDKAQPTASTSKRPGADSTRMKMLTNNAFASALVFYWSYRRNKLNTESSKKIAKKYASKPAQLITDLTEKYQQPIHTEVSCIEVERILKEIDIASEYRALLPTSICSETYDVALDPTSTKFDVEKLFSTTGALQTRNPYVLSVDNLSKVKHLLPGYSGNLPRFGKVEPVNVSITSVLKANHGKELPFINRIAIDSTSHDSKKDGQVATSEPEPDSPLILLYNCMTQKQRVRVTVRNRRRLHAHLVGYVSAFDKHFNLLLRDVDEEIICEKKLTSSSLGNQEVSTSQKEARKRRHTRELLVRGDVIVLIANFDRPRPAAIAT